ncbi:MAG: NAD(P)H-hydrate dehydratase [Clostridiales Family XIII bacterium]|jgi:NAD(P)H-hydrate epimerase|nr:NAD(P)H-hydrate dehydratase [Clostridiales Family XIII bacterium]
MSEIKSNIPIYSETKIICEDSIRTALPIRKKDTHKYDYGRILIVAGSEGMVGAAAFAAKAALRTGAGLVQVCIDKNLWPIITNLIPEVVLIDRDEIIKRNLTIYDAIVIGPGLGLEKSEKMLFYIKHIIDNYNGPLILDADALNLVSSSNIDLLNYHNNIIVTPHMGEARRLIERTDVQFSTLSRKDIAMKISSYYGVDVILKGHETLVYLRNGDRYINPTGNPGMATAGAGDVLSGMLAALLGQGLSNEDAVIAAVYLHGLAGDIAATKFGEFSLIASDIIDAIPEAIMSIMYIL